MPRVPPYRDPLTRATDMYRSAQRASTYVTTLIETAAEGLDPRTHEGLRAALVLIDCAKVELHAHRERAFIEAEHKRVEARE